MPTEIRAPLTLPLPVGNSLRDSAEESRSEVQMEVGVSRRRNRYRVTPRVFELLWDVTLDQYQDFDNWYQYTIEGGSKPFDVQFVDELDVVAWRTVYAIGEYSAKLMDGYSWQIRMTVRSITDPFYARSSGTDELRSLCSLKVVATGNLQVLKVLRGAASIGIKSAKTYVLPNPMGGFIELKLTAPGFIRPKPVWGVAGLYLTTSGRLNDMGDPSLVLQFDGVSWTADDGGSMLLQFDNVYYIPPSIS